jgi:signal transduction histidine kinase
MAKLIENEKLFLKVIFCLILGTMTILFSLSLYQSIRKEYQIAREYAEVEAQASFSKDILYRRWAAVHGGVYVPVTDTTLPNKYLDFMSERDIITPSGRKLTLMNSAYMSRQVYSMNGGQNEIKGHITSLEPINPGNKPEEWEIAALKSFEQGRTKYVDIEEINGVEYLRFMKPMLIEPNCLKCHKRQGFKTGDIKGGISFVVSLEKYNRIAASSIKHLVITHILIYLALVCFAIYGLRKSQHEIYRRSIARVELEKAKTKAEENDKLKTAFLQNMSHEIRTPLNAICGFSELLENKELSEEKRRNYISIIQNSSEQLLSIVTNVLTISSLETKQERVVKQSVSINAILKEMDLMFRKQAEHQGVRLSAYLRHNDLCVITDRTKLRQILTNLISNALKFTSEGFVEFGYSLKEDFVEFFVKDSGIGVRPELSDLIFERFRQGDNATNKLYGGTGLGLTISKSFAELLGGKIWLKSEPGKGSVFCFNIPYEPAGETVF